MPAYNSNGTTDGKMRNSTVNWSLPAGWIERSRSPSSRFQRDTEYLAIMSWVTSLAINNQRASRSIDIRRRLISNYHYLHDSQFAQSSSYHQYCFARLTFVVHDRSGCNEYTAARYASCVQHFVGQHHDTVPRILPFISLRLTKSLEIAPWASALAAHLLKIPIF